MSRKSLLQEAKALKDQADAIKNNPIRQLEYLCLMCEYHSCMSEWWDNKVGSILMTMINVPKNGNIAVTN